jgi:ABC-type Fe3+-siderophore transport system permease subunit
MSGLGRTLIILGLVIVLVGVVVSLAGKLPWLGRLPGDIAIKRENFSFYFPLGTCLLLSALLSLVMWLFRR